MRIPLPSNSLTTFASEPEEFVVPEDLSPEAISDSELSDLHEQAVSLFDQTYGEGTGLTEQALVALNGLANGIDTIRSEIERRLALDAERAEAAAELASRVRPPGELVDETSSEDGEEALIDVSDDLATALVDAGAAVSVEPQGGPQEEYPENGEAYPEAEVVASGRREIRVNLSGVHRNPVPRPRQVAGPTRMEDIVFAAEGVSGVRSGQGLNWDDVGHALDRRLQSFNIGQWQNAQRSGRHIRQQAGLLVIHNPFEPGLVIESNDPGHVDEVMRRAMDEHRLPGGSLVASGGWCAPSETRYDLCELESRDGLVSIPTVGISRGGINYTQGPDFSEIYANTGFCYTEEEVIDGDFDGQGGGSKPCYDIPCPDFSESRLGLCGLCLTAGLLQSRGYPELVARVTRGALVAHDHRMSANIINQIIAGSTAVTFPANQAGATAPILTAIELQVEHFRYVNRLSRTTSLEAIFPYWVRGAIRSDLSRRLGVDLIDVTDARIDAWFAERGIAPQFVYDWQDIGTGGAAAFTSWPTTVTFLLYAAGTWVQGSSDIITLDTVYDSTLLGQNKYTALFSEEGYLVAKMCHDSRAITVPICPDGATHGGIDIACDGTVAA